MKLILFLLRASWRVVLAAGVVGGISGAASVALIASINRALFGGPQASSTGLAVMFAALCGVILTTQIASQMLLAWLTHTSIAQLRIGLARRILESPLKHLEEIGTHSMLAALTSDVAVVSQAMNGVPVVATNVVILVCGSVYLGWLSPGVLAGALAFCVFGVASYWYFSNFAQRYLERAREVQDLVTKRIEELLGGVKELKMHRARRREFLDNVLRPAEWTLRDRQFVGDSLNNAAIAWGHLMFFVAIGLLLFAGRAFFGVNADTLIASVFLILYLMSPLEQIMGWLPFLGWAAASVAQIERLGLMLDEKEPESVVPEPVSCWHHIDFAGVTHAYRREGQPHGFVLGPIDLTFVPGEIVFIIGGNGSGKTTLGKLITGLYAPECGEVRLDGRPIDGANREDYRQLFSVVFDDAVVFDSLWGLDADDLDHRAGEYLRRLELDHKVTVTDGAFSTVQLSRGQRKRLALLTAYLEDRPIYVFDEWAADQDPVFRKIFYLRLLPELKRRGKTVVAITHDDRYFAYADRIVKLEVGQVVETFSHEALQEAELETR